MVRELQFRLLCHRHCDDIYRYARSLLRNTADAEDATQEVLLRLWQNLSTTRFSNVRAWLLRTHAITASTRSADGLIRQPPSWSARTFLVNCRMISQMIPVPVSMEILFAGVSRTPYRSCPRRSAVCSSSTRSTACVIGRSPRRSIFRSTASRSISCALERNYNTCCPSKDHG